MASNIVKNWFLEDYNKLHPLLQALHQTDSTLTGAVTVAYRTGLAGFLGRRLGQSLGVPPAGQHDFSVSIYQASDGLHWDRTFNKTNGMKSLFVPVRTKTNGHWLEKTGPITLQLTVVIKNGGWYWHCQKIKVRGVPFPLWFFPKTTAFKTIEAGRYRFFVGFSLPVVGNILSYSGLLDASAVNEAN